MNFRACSAHILLVLLIVGLMGLPGGVQAKAKPHHTTYTPTPTEAELFDALKKGVYGSQKDRSAADALFRRVLRSDQAEPVSYIYYPVYGSDPQAVRASQAQAKAQVGISEWGYTYSKWSYQYDANGPVRLTLQTSITMPKWAPNGSSHASPYFWKGFYSALLYHEQGHHLIGEYVVALMRLRLNEAESSASANAGAICSQVGAEMDTLNQQYDQVTNHGVSQGAVL